MKQARVTLDELPLFAADRDIARAVVGADEERVKDFIRKIGTTLERDGFPKVDPFYGGRYVPAVKQFFEAQMMSRQPGDAHVFRRRA